MESANKGLDPGENPLQNPSFSDIPLSQESSSTPLPLDQEDNDLSDPDTLVSDSENDAEAASRYLQNGVSSHRPSFTIGGSDSDSTSVASTSASGCEMEHHLHSHAHRRSTLTSSTLKSIPSDSDTLQDGQSRASGDPVPQGRPGYMGGSYSRSNSTSRSRSPSHSALDKSLTSSNASGLTTSRGGVPAGDQLEVSYKEIRLFAVKDGDLPPKPFNSRQWLTFLVFGFVELFSAMVISLQAPFYPLEAEKKGATATEYGLVFGIFELTVFIISPIYGSKISKIGPKLVFSLGILVTSLAAIGFGFLDQINNRSLFVGLSILTRIIEALGEAAFITASFVIIAAEFPHSVATTFAAMETFYGLGLIIGPLVGGLLYQVGGYTLPFLSVGGALLLAALLTIFALPSTKNPSPSSPSRQTSTPPTSGFSMFRLLTLPTIGLAGFSIFSASASISYLNATMEPFIRQNGLSPSPLATGAIFIVNGGVYAITSPLWGCLCDRLDNLNSLKVVTLVGTGLIGVGFGLIGPIPYVNLQPSLWGVIVGQTIQGVGLGAVLVSAFIQSLREAIKSGLPDNVQTYSLVSGVWTSMFALGAFVGPTISGVLYDHVGFRQGTFSILGLQLILAILVLTSMIWTTCCSSSTTRYGELVENAPLLSSERGSGHSSPSRRPQSPGPSHGVAGPKQRQLANPNKNGIHYGSV